MVPDLATAGSKNNFHLLNIRRRTTDFPSKKKNRKGRLSTKKKKKKTSLPRIKAELINFRLSHYLATIAEIKRRTKKNPKIDFFFELSIFGVADARCVIAQYEREIRKRKKNHFWNN